MMGYVTTYYNWINITNYLNRNLTNENSGLMILNGDMGIWSG